MRTCWDWVMSVIDRIVLSGTGIGLAGSLAHSIVALASGQSDVTGVLHRHAICHTSTHDLFLLLAPIHVVPDTASTVWTGGVPMSCREALVEDDFG